MVAVKSLNKFLSLALSLFVLIGCERTPLRRPFGEMRLGAITEFTAPETYLKGKHLVLRRDDRGFSVMSTECTYDLTQLVRKSQPDGSRVFVSQYSESQYADDGSVLHGPATSNLPYYEMRLSLGTLGGPLDTLYVSIGKEVSKEWRLKVP